MLTPHTKTNTKHIDLVYKNLIDKLPFAVSYVDDKLIYQFVNNQYCKWFNIAPYEVIGKSIKERLLASSASEILPNILDALSGNSLSYSTNTNYANGQSFKTEIELIPNTVNGHTIGVYILIKDITEILAHQKKVEKFYLDKQKLKSIFENNSVGMLVTNLDEDIVEVNKAICTALGYTKTEIINKKLRQFMDPNQEILGPKETANLLRDKKQKFSVNRIFLSKNSKKIYCRVNVSGIYDSEGELVNQVGIIEDISEQKKLELELIKRERRFQKIVETMSEGLIFVDNNRTVQFANNKYMQLTGYNIEDLYGKDVAQMIDEELSSDAYKDFKKSNKLEGIEIAVKTANGNIQHHLISRAPIFDMPEQTIGFVEVHTNITELRETQTKIKIANAMLEDKVEQRTKALKYSNEQLEQFAYVISHDLKEPLRMISNYIQLLEGQDAVSACDASKEYMDFIADGANRMRSLLEGILQYSRINTKKEAFSEVNVNQTLEHLEVIFKSKLEDADGVLTYPNNLPKIKGDKFQIHQLFQNLISNALKFTHNKPIVKINCVEHSNEFVFTVSDNGIGIEKQFEERIFKMFQRLHTRKEFSGHGIGLTICKNIVERHGGELSVSSEKDVGTTFTFSIEKQKS